jgi:mannosyltransferase OCH1-like enzyme
MQPWIDSWTTVGFPGAEHNLASFDTGLAVVAEVAGELGRRAFEAAPHAAVRADLFRYAELFKRGGWYVDAEHEALLSTLDVLECPVDHVLIVRTVYDRILNNFIGAVPGSSFMKAALLRGCQNLLDNAGGSVIELTGPIMFTEMFREYEASADASFVVIPSKVVLTGALQKVHNDAEYKIHGHWRYTELSSDL